MGFSLSWAAVRGATPTAALSALGLRGTGSHEDFPESEIVGAALANDWYLIVKKTE